MAEYGETYASPICELLSLFAKPYVRAKASEEHSHSGVLCDVLRIVVEATVWDVPEIQLTAAQVLLAFIEAHGFDEAGRLGSTAASEARQTSWQFHQQLLRAGEGQLVEGLVVAFRSHVTRFLDGHGGSVHSDFDAEASQTGSQDAGSYGQQQQQSQLQAQQTFGATLAIRAAGIARVPDTINILGRILREVSEDTDNAVILTRVGLPQLCTALMARIENLKEPLLQTVVETLWNLLEHSAIKATAVQQGRTGEAALSLVELMDKHRMSNAVRILASPVDMLAVRTLLERAILFGSTQAEKELRNDVLSVATLIARKPENRPVFASTGLLDVLLCYATAAETDRETNAPLAHYATPSLPDMELKQMAWLLIATLCQGPFADHEVVSMDSEEQEGSAASSCLALVRESSFLQSLLAYLDPAQLAHPYLALWSAPHRRALELQALQLLTVIGPLFPLEFHRANGLSILVGYLRLHTDVLSVDSARSPSSSAADGKDEDDYDTAYGSGSSATGSAASSKAPTALAVPVSPNNHLEHDVGRQYAVLRALLSLAQIGSRSDTEHHLSAMVTAGVPTVVAPQLRSRSKSGTRGTAEDPVYIGSSICMQLGELGLLEDLVTVLKYVPEGGEEISPSSNGESKSLGESTSFAKVWTGTVAAKATSRGILESTGYGPGITEVTPSTMIAEGRTVVPTPLLKEALLTLIAALTRAAADSAAAKTAQNLHNIIYVSPPSNGENADAFKLPSAENSPVRKEGSVSSVATTALHGIQENQVRIRKVGGVSAILRVLKRCVQDARKRAIGEFASTTVRPRVATAGLWAMRCSILGNVRSEARFLAEGGIDVLLDLAEAGPATLKPLAITVLADLARNPISHICVQSWRSDINGASAGRLLLQLWADEEARLGVVHTPETVLIANFARPLDGGDAAARQLAVFASSHTPTAAAVKDIVPGGRKSLVAKPRARSPSPDGGDTGEVSAFRALRRALRAAKLWQHVETKVPGGALASHAASMDLRHKLFAALEALGFAALDDEVIALDVVAQSGTDSKLSVESEEDAKDTDEYVSPLIAQERAERAAEAALAVGRNDAIIFPDLSHDDQVRLQLARYYPDFVVGAAYDDVRTRLAELAMDPVNEDAEELQRQLEACAAAAKRAHAMQALHAKGRKKALHASEKAFLKGVISRRNAEEEAMRFAARNSRKPWAQSGKTFVGLTVEERKAGMADRSRMLSESYVGYRPFPGAENPTEL
jgi:hypothetical protein